MILVLCVQFITLFFSAFLYAWIVESKDLIAKTSLSRYERTKLVREKIRRIMIQKRLRALYLSDNEEDNKKVEKIESIIKNKINNHLWYKKIQIKYNSIETNLKHVYNFDLTDKFTYKTLQEKSLSCELSATSDIISYLEDKRVAESFVIRLVAKSHYNTLPRIEWDKKMWWNPNAWYVWYIHELPSWEKATQIAVTWYWVLEQPINKIYNQFRFKTKVITNRDHNHNYSKKAHLTDLLKTINEWNMVQLWWDYCTEPKYEDTENRNPCKDFYDDRKIEWYYKKGWELVKHEWLIWEHAFYLLWYKWWVENPNHIIVWDTLTWRHVYPINEWMRKWDKMQNRSIIVYKKQKELTKR